MRTTLHIQFYIKWDTCLAIRGAEQAAPRRRRVELAQLQDEIGARLSRRREGVLAVLVQGRDHLLPVEAASDRPAKDELAFFADVPCAAQDAAAQLADGSDLRLVRAAELRVAAAVAYGRQQAVEPRLGQADPAEVPAAEARRHLGEQRRGQRAVVFVHRRIIRGGCRLFYHRRCITPILNGGIIDWGGISHDPQDQGSDLR